MSENTEKRPLVVRPARRPLCGRIRVPGDKSIAHRAVMLNAIGTGEAWVRGLPSGHDVRSTIAAMRALGCRIDATEGAARIVGSEGRLRDPAAVIDCGNSGTTMRLLAGLLAGAGVRATLDGDASLRRRPMERVAEPLRRLGARIETTDGRPPVHVQPTRLHAAAIALPVASAQLKSAVLLAGLFARGRTQVCEPAASRDHTERMLAAMGCRLSREGTCAVIEGPCVPRCMALDVCGDPSSAAFFVVAAALVADSDLTIEAVCLNPTRIGFVALLRRMGVPIELTVEREIAGEPVGTLRVRASSGLKGIDVAPEEVPAAIDELPLVALASAFAEGTTRLAGVGELRVKESDRIATTERMIRALGGRAEADGDSLVVHGGGLRGGAEVSTGGDHRLVMGASVAALACREPVAIDEPDAAGVSYPEFFRTLERLAL